MAPKAMKKPAAKTNAATEASPLALTDREAELLVGNTQEEENHEEEEEQEEEQKEEDELEEEEAEEEKKDTNTKPKGAKAKAKKKTSPKPKAKGKGKTAKKTMKRPAARGSDEDEEKKKETLADKCEKWQHLGKQGKKRAAEDEEEEEGDDDTAEKRHRGKARKFKKMSDPGAIPEHIMLMFEKEAAKHPKPRKFKSDLINKLVKEDGNGGYTMCADDPWFQQQKEMIHKKYGKDEHQGTPRDVFAYQVFHGNFEALDSASQKGSVQQWTQDGVDSCGYRKTKAGVENSKQEMTKFGANQVQLKGSQYQALNKAFRTMSWKFSMDGQDTMAQVGGTSSGSGQAKPLENAGLTKEMVETLTEAKNAHEKLHSTAMKLLSKCCCLDDKKEFKTTVMALKDWSLKNDHILTWQACFFICYYTRMYMCMQHHSSYFLGTWPITFHVVSACCFPARSFQIHKL